MNWRTSIYTSVLFVLPILHFFGFFPGEIIVLSYLIPFNPSSDNPAKRSNTLKQFCGVDA